MDKAPFDLILMGAHTSTHVEHSKPNRGVPGRVLLDGGGSKSEGRGCCMMMPYQGHTFCASGDTREMKLQSLDTATFGDPRLIEGKLIEVRFPEQNTRSQFRWQTFCLFSTAFCSGLTPNPDSSSQARPEIPANCNKIMKEPSSHVESHP